MVIIQTVWFTEMSSNRPIGIVIGRNDVGQKNIYIGTGTGIDEQADAIHIMETGAKLESNIFKDMVERLEDK